MKTFNEVFPSLNLEGGLKSIFEMSQVERITAPPDMRFIKLYVEIPRLIDNSVIKNMEEYIKHNLFPKKEIKIEIVPHFKLSSQYNPEHLFDAYKDTIYEELKSRSILEYRIIHNAQIDFTDAEMTFTVEDTDINRHIADNVRRYLTNIFNVRCSIPCNVSFTYVAPKFIKKYEEEIAEPVKRVRNEDFISADEIKPNSGFTVVLEEKEKKKDRRISKSEDEPRHKKSNYVKKSSNPDVMFGKDFPDEFTSIKDIFTEMGDVNVKGQILDLDSRHIEKNNLDLYIFTITDFSDSINVKIFVKEEDQEEFKTLIHNGDYIKLRGTTMIDRFDNELIIGSVKGIKKCEPFSNILRKDNAPIKRVELHCHTKMSDFDGIASAESIVKTAAKWGMPAIAITDHGNVQSFPEAYHTAEKIDGPFKIIYGVEAYLVDDLNDIIINPEDKTLDDSFVVFDIETTGLSTASDNIIEIGAVKIIAGEITERFSTFVNPERPIPYNIENITGISDSMVSDARTIDKVLPDFLNFCNGSAIVAHNSSFDCSFIKRESLRLGYDWNHTVLDTLTLSHLLLPQLNKYKLDSVAKALEIELENHHRAVDDAECTAHIFIKLSSILRERGLELLSDINAMASSDANYVKKQPTYHAIILVQNDPGRVNLYRLISESHINYYNKRPRIPKSLLQKYRDGLILGSACEAGELYSAILRGDSETELKRIVDFYDYLEIQPVGNNLFMIEDDRYPVHSEEDIINHNKLIVNLGEKFNKPVVATCDVHFLNPEDEVYRRVIMYDRGFEDADKQAPLYLRTTEEMLAEFQYLGSEKANEVVIENSLKIADRIESISPVRPDKCPPVLPDSDKNLTEACYAKAYEQYGEVLPEIVKSRLDKELNSIISNGFAVMYIIAKLLVEKSNSDGYLVGSRGSVGSSFAAYTSGITEVNPLPPHYYCTECKYSEFDTPEVKAFAGKAGCDMPDKICPVCGKPLKKDGFDIPFETFLGFKGDKEPDIDLNFSGEYQSKAHAYTEEIFGEGHTFRAGTVGGIAEKTAFGYVKKYFEEHGEAKRKCEINRLLKGCVGVKRTTGQHPGGIVVLPHGEEIYSFTPIQRPANDQTTNIITTHFEYHAIDHNLLKLDILGHQAPTMIRMLQDLTGIDPVKDIPLDSKETMSLFKSTDILGITPDDISGCPLGSLGIPEFGTDFAMQMLIEADPQAFSDLVRIAGLAHGTDVWIGNARDLILSGQATISTAICTRDDIMTYLISMGLDPNASFKIMEDVRKGKVAKGASKNWPEWEEDMRAHEVPEWYIDSCKKIKYMFPKAHAAAYVMMSWRIAYCKIFYPLAYYAAYFSIMGNGFSYETMGQGPERLKAAMKELRSKGDKMTAREAEMFRDMRIAEEMYARGIEMLPIDLYKSKSSRFIIEDGKLRPCFTSIDGLGESAANQMELAAQSGPYVSKDDFRSRAKVGQTLCDLLDSLGILRGVPESDQISIFDL